MIFELEVKQLLMTFNAANSFNITATEKKLYFSNCVSYLLVLSLVVVCRTRHRVL